MILSLMERCMWMNEEAQTYLSYGSEIFIVFSELFVVILLKCQSVALFIFLVIYMCVYFFGRYKI